MGLTVPNSVDATYPSQSMLNAREVDALVAGDNATFVVTGCAVSYHSAGANMSVDVTSGVIASTGTSVYVAGGTLTITTADATNPRLDAVVASSAGVLSVVAGTPVAVTTTTAPAIPTIAAGSVLLAAVHVPAGVTSITATMVTDKRVIQTIGPYYDSRLGQKNFRAAKGKIASRSMDLLFVGTSLTEGYYATSEQAKWTYLLRQILQAALNPNGAPGGEGYVAAVHGTTTASAYGTAAFADRVVMSGTGYTIDRTNAQPFGLGRRAVYLSSSTATATFTTSTCDRLWVLFTQGASVGNLSIAIDGGAAVLVPTYNASLTRSGRVWDSGVLTRGVHTVVVKADNTASAPANIYNAVLEGFMLFDGDGGPGPANQLTPEWANVDGNYDVTTTGQFWNALAANANWVACSLATTTAQAFQGTKSIAMTCTGGANPGYVGGYIQARPRTRMTFTYRVRSAATPRNFTSYLGLYSANADGSFNAQTGTLTGTNTVTSTTSGWTIVANTFDIPDGTGWVALIPSMTGTPAASEVHYHDGYDWALASYSGAGVINTTFQDPNDGTAQGRGVRVWEAGHAGFVASDFAGASSTSVSSTTGSWLDCLDAANPDHIFIEFGTNESINGVAATTLRDNLVTIVTNVRARCTTISPSITLLAFNPNPTVAGNAAWVAQDGYRDQIRAAARAAGVDFLDVGAYFPVTNKTGELGTGTFPQPNVHDLLYEDGVHNTIYGQAEIAQMLATYLLGGDPRSTTRTPLNNYTATTDPAATNDITQGYGVGSEWDNTTKRITWKCTDPTANAAVWEQVKRGPLGSLTSTAATSSTTETVLLTGSIPANAWYAGEHIDFELEGTSSSTGTLIFKVHVGTAGTTSDALVATFTTSAAQVANQHAGVRGKIKCASTGSSGTVYAGGQAFAGTALLPLTGTAATSTVNTTVAQKITVTCTCSIGTFTAWIGQVG